MQIQENIRRHNYFCFQHQTLFESEMFVAQLSLTLCNPMNYNPSSFVQGIIRARILQWIAISFSRVSSQPRNQIWMSCIAGRFFTN